MNLLVPSIDETMNLHYKMQAMKSYRELVASQVIISLTVKMLDEDCTENQMRTMVRKAKRIAELLAEEMFPDIAQG